MTKHLSFSSNRRPSHSDYFLPASQFRHHYQALIQSENKRVDRESSRRNPFHHPINLAISVSEVYSLQLNTPQSSFSPTSIDSIVCVHLNRKSNVHQTLSHSEGNSCIPTNVIDYHQLHAPTSVIELMLLLQKHQHPLLHSRCLKLVE